MLASSASCYPVFPSASSLLCQSSLKSKRRGLVWDRATFLNNGLTAVSKQVHKADTTEELCAWKTVFWLLVIPSCGTSLCLSSLTHCMHALISVFVLLAIKQHFLCLSGFFKSGYDLHEKWLRTGPLPVFLPLSTHSFIPNSSHLCSFLALCCALYKRAA